MSTPAEKLRRRPLFKRGKTPRVMTSRAGRFVVTERDLDIVTDIARHRFMNTAQIVRLWSCDCPLVEKTGVRYGEPAPIAVKAHQANCTADKSQITTGDDGHRSRDLFKDGVHLKTRLRELFQQGYLDRPLAQLYLRTSAERGIIRKGSSPMVYCPTTKGIEAIGPRRRSSLGHEKLSWVGKPNEGNRFYMAHTLAIADASVGVDCGVRVTESLQRLSDEELFSGMSEQRRRSGKRWQLEVRHQGVPISVVCDLTFGIGDRGRGRKYNFLCEIDMGTMQIESEDLGKSTIIRKLVGYARAQHDDTFRREFGWSGARVLFLTTSEARMQSMIDAARRRFRKAPEGRLFLFGTLAASQDLLRYEFRDIDGKLVKLVGRYVENPAKLFE